MEKIEKISKEYEDYFGDVKNEIFEGLKILSKYSDDLNINPAHDEIWAGFDKDEMYEKMSDEDIHSMFKLNWRWDEESFVIFT